jgi:hypothetical protein
MKAYTVESRLEEIHKLIPHSHHITEIGLIKKLMICTIDELDNVIECTPEGTTHFQLEGGYLAPFKIVGLAVHGIIPETNDWGFVFNLESHEDLVGLSRSKVVINYLAMHLDLSQLIGNVDKVREFYHNQVKLSKHFFNLDGLLLNVDILKYYLDFLELTKGE